MTTTDDGLPAAAARTQDALGCEPFESVHDGETYCRMHNYQWVTTGGFDCCSTALAVARAAREDVAETVREAMLLQHKNDGACPAESIEYRDPTCVACAAIPTQSGDVWHSEDGLEYATRDEALAADKAEQTRAGEA